MPAISNHRVLAISQRIFKSFLGLYPKPHREEYGPAMAQLFRDQSRDAWKESRGWGLVKLWLRVLPDLGKTAMLERISTFNPIKSMTDKMSSLVRPTPLFTFFGVFTVVFLLILITSVAITFILPESYASTARMLIVPDEANSNGAPLISNKSSDPYFIQTTFEVMQSEVVLSEVIAALDLNAKWGKKYNNGEPLKTTETAAILRGDMVLAPVRNSNLVSVTVYSDDPKEAAQIANAMADAYKDYRIKNTTSRAGFISASPVQIVDPAEPGKFPVKPNKPLNIFIGAVVGGMLGLLIGAASAFTVAKWGNRERKNPASV